MDKIKTVKIKNLDGSVSEETYSISVDAKNVDMDNGKELQETIGTINIDTDGNIAYQLNNLKNNKVNKIDIIDNLNSAESNKVLSANQGKVLGDNITVLNEDIKKKPYYYNSVADMKADLKLKEGDMAVTLGYYSVNDGGAGEYIIKSSSDLFNELLNNNLVAELIIKDSMNIKCFGVYGNGINNDTILFQTAIDTMSNNKGELIIAGGTYLVSNTLNINQNTKLNIADKVTINSNYDGVLFLYEEDDNTSNINIIKGSGILYLHSNTGIDSNSVGLQIGSDTSENVNDICFSNLTINNFNVGCNLINKNVWNITFEKCDFFHNNIGVKYGGLTHRNAGERIAFNTCLFTQNKIDVTILSTLWSQMNFHNCSFDFSDCAFYIDWKEPTYTSNRNKISLNQCHIEGISNNLNIIPNDRPVGILYADSLYGIIFSITDSIIALSRSYYWFKVINHSNDNISRIILKNIFIYGSGTEKKYVPSLSNAEVDYQNIYWAPEIDTISGTYGRRIPSVPISDKVLINDDPYFKNETAGDYTPTNNLVVGDYTLKYVTGATNLSVANNTEFTDGGKKLVLTLDTSYSEQYITGLNLNCNKKFKVQPNKKIACQIYTDLIQNSNNTHKTASIEVFYYDIDGNQIGTNYYYFLTKASYDNDMAVIETTPFTVPSNTDYLKFNVTVRNGDAGEIIETRTIKGIYIYYLD